MKSADLADFSLADIKTSWKRNSLLIFLELSTSSTTSSCFTSSLLNPPLSYRKGEGKEKKYINYFTFIFI